MKTIQSKVRFRNFPLALLVLFLTAQHVWGEVDLMGGNKSDSTIKMLVFPKSLRVVENFGEGKVNKKFSDPKRIKKTLLKLDPARIVPAKMGEPITGPITRDSLKHLAKQYSEDVILIFRRSVDNEKNSIRHQGLFYLAKLSFLKLVGRLAFFEFMGMENFLCLFSQGFKSCQIHFLDTFRT